MMPKVSTARRAHRLADFAGGGDRVVDVPGQCLGLLGGLGQVAEHRGDAGGAEPQEIEPHVLHGEHAGLEMARHLSPAAAQVDDRLALALKQIEPPGPLLVVRLLGQRRDPLVDLSQPLGVHVAVHRVERARHVGRALVQAVDRLLHLGEQLALGGRQAVEELEDGLPVALHLADGVDMGAELVRPRRRKLARHPGRALDERRLDRVGRGWTGQHVPPAVAGLPELGVVPEHADAHAEHGEEEPRIADPGGDVDPEAAQGDGRPARELAAHLLDDLRLAGVRHLILVGPPLAVVAPAHAPLVPGRRHRPRAEPRPGRRTGEPRRLAVPGGWRGRAPVRGRGSAFGSKRCPLNEVPVGR